MIKLNTEFINTGEMILKLDRSDHEYKHYISDIVDNILRLSDIKSLREVHKYYDCTEFMMFSMMGIIVFRYEELFEFALKIGIDMNSKHSKDSNSFYDEMVKRKAHSLIAIYEDFEINKSHSTKQSSPSYSSLSL